jgi:hypothetical protein
LALATIALGVIVPSAWAWTVTLDAQPKLKRTHSWKIEKSAGVSTLTLKKGETATVSYSVTVSPAAAPVDSDWSVSGNMEMSEDPDVRINSVIHRIEPLGDYDNSELILASQECMPVTFPVELGIEGLKCTYSAALPNADSRNTWMRATTTVQQESGPVNGFRNHRTAFDFSTATVDHVDECVDVTDSMAGALGTVCAADAPKTFTYSTTVGPFNDCGSKTVNNTAHFKTNDSGTMGSATDSISVTVTGCEPPKPKCPLPSLVWKFVSIIGPTHVKPLLPISLGTAGGSKTSTVTTPLGAAMVLGAELYSSNVVALLKVELLAAKLNAATGRDVSSIAAAMAEADAFLAAKDTNSYLSYSEKAKAKSLTVTLEAFNNKCFNFNHDWCKKHWEKPDHDWHKWNWKKHDWDD